jgi:hypothetical protein
MLKLNSKSYTHSLRFFRYLPTLQPVIQKTAMLLHKSKAFVLEWIVIIELLRAELYEYVIKLFSSVLP